MVIKENIKHCQHEKVKEQEVQATFVTIKIKGVKVDIAVIYSSP